MKKIISVFIIAGIFLSPCSADAATIDSMTIGSSYTYTPGGQFLFLGTAKEYFLSDGTSWSSGAGSQQNVPVALQTVEISGNTVKYIFIPPDGGILYSHTDYDAGEHSSQGVFGTAGPLVIEAQLGGTSATISGYVQIISNEETSYGVPRFNYFSVGVGTLVKYSITYTLQGGSTWTANLFDSSFSYTLSGVIDLSPPEKGDINNDGNIDLHDTILALQVLVDNSHSINFYPSSDVNSDSRIGLEEAIYAIQWTAGLYNHPPLLEGIGNKTVYENSTLSFTISATDPDGDSLTYSVMGLPQGAAFDPGTRNFSWTPTYQQSGAYPVTFVVKDKFGIADSETITITVNKTPVFVAPEYFPLNVGDWWDFKDDNTGQVGRTRISGTILAGGLGGTMAKIYQYPTGEKEYYTSDANGIKTYGSYIQTAEYTGNIFFNTPILLLPNNAPIGTTQVSSAVYPLTVFVPEYGSYVTVHVTFTATTAVLGLEDVVTQNMILKDCIKVSLSVSQYIQEISQTMPEETITYWLYKGVGVVKQMFAGNSATITGSYVNGVQQSY